MRHLELSEPLQERLQALATKTRRSVYEVAAQALADGIQDLEEGLLALERLGSGELEFQTIEEVRIALGLRDEF